MGFFKNGTERSMVSAPAGKPYGHCGAVRCHGGCDAGLDERTEESRWKIEDAGGLHWI